MAITVTHTFVSPVVDDADPNKVGPDEWNAAHTVSGAAASGANTDITSVYLDNTGLKVKDTNASHGLIIAPGSDLSADRTLTITTGDAARTLTISASATVSQDYSSTGNPQFATIELGAASDTTLSRSSAGVLAVEGVTVAMNATSAAHTAGTIELGHASDTTIARVSAGVASIEGVTILTTATGQPLDATLTALAAHSTNGLLTQTAADTFTGRTVTGTANQIDVANGNGVSGNPTLSLPADVLIPTVLTVPNTGLHLLDTNASHDVIIKPGANVTADRTLTITTADADQTLTITGSPTISQDYSTTGNPQFATIELGAASDTTLSRSSAGILAVEGVTVSLNSTSATHTAGTIELGAASDTTLSRSSAGVLAVEGVTVSLNSTSATHTAGTIELGAASDTTIARVSAGVISVEGSTVWTAGNDGASSGLDADLLDGKNTGTSGNTVPLLDGTNTWSGQQTISLGSAAATEPLRLVNTTDAASVQVAQLEGDRATMAANDEAYVSLVLSDSGGTQTEFGRLTWKATTVTDTTEAGRLQFGVMTAGSLADEVYLTGANFYPASNDGNALGLSGTAWSDLFLADGGVVNFNAGNYTLTHSAGLLTANGALSVGTSNAITAGTIELGAASDTTISRSSAGVIAVEGVTVSLNSTSATHTAGTIELGAASDTTLARVSAGVVSIEGVTILTTATGQPLDADLTSWAGVTRASGFDTFAATPSSANLRSLVTDETGTGALVFADAPQMSTIELGAASDTTLARVSAGVISVEGSTVAMLPTAQTFTAQQTISVGSAATTEPLRLVNSTDNASVQGIQIEGDRATMAANDEVYASFLLSDSAGNQDENGRITVKATTVTSGAGQAGRMQFGVLTANTLADELYLTGTELSPAANDGLALGTTTLGFADLHLATGGVINWANGEVTLTETDANTLTVAGASAVSLGTSAAFTTGTIELGAASDNTFSRLGAGMAAVEGGLITATKIFRLDANLAGANNNSVQSLFGVGVTLAASTVYAFEQHFTLTKSAGTTSHTISIGWGGTATLNNFFAQFIANQTAVAPATVGTPVNYTFLTATAVALTGAITTASTHFRYMITGTVSINAGGTFIPQYTLSAAPGGAYSTVAGSYIEIWPIGAAGANVNVGSWA